MKDYYTLQQASIEADETTLTVRTDDLRRIPVEQVAGLHLLSGYTLTSGVLELAAQHTFPIHAYNYYGAYRGTYLPREVDTSAWTIIRQVQENQDQSKRLSRAREILEATWKSMVNMLAPFGHEPLPLDEPGTLEDLRLNEARIRKAYYAICDTFLPPFWSIIRRERRPPRRPADAVLGFANGILYAKVTGWIHRAGLDPRIGYLHGDKRASNPLALDLAELMKPTVSEATLFTIAASGQERSLITKVEEGCYLNEKGRKAVIQTMEELLSTQSSVSVLDRDVTLGRASELVPVKLHRAIVADAPARYPIPSCTLSSSTMRILKQGRTSVDS